MDLRRDGGAAAVSIATSLVLAILRHLQSCSSGPPGLPCLKKPLLKTPFWPLISVSKEASEEEKRPPPPSEDALTNPSMPTNSPRSMSLTTARDYDETVEARTAYVVVS